MSFSPSNVHYPEIYNGYVQKYYLGKFEQYPSISSGSPGNTCGVAQVYPALAAHLVIKHPAYQRFNY